MSVYNVRTGAFAFAHTVMSPHAVCEESFHDLLLFGIARAYGVEQVCVVNHDLYGFLGKLFAFAVNKVHEPCLLQIFYVVHYRGARGAYLVGEFGYIWRGNAFHAQQIEQFAYSCQIFQVYLLYEQNVNLDHHVYRLQQLFREVVCFEEERIVAVVEVILEIVPRTYFRKNGLQYLFVSFENFVKTVRTEIQTGLRVYKFAE